MHASELDLADAGLAPAEVSQERPANGRPSVALVARANDGRGVLALHRMIGNAGVGRLLSTQRPTVQRACCPSCAQGRDCDRDEELPDDATWPLTRALQRAVLDRRTRPEHARAPLRDLRPDASSQTLGRTRGSTTAKLGTLLRQRNRDRPPGRCTWTEYETLRYWVDLLCHGWPGCSIADSCEDLETKIDLMTACMRARQALMWTCFFGGNRTHRENAIEDLARAISNCWYYKERRNCPPRPEPAPAPAPEAHPRTAEGVREFEWEGPAYHGKLLWETRAREVPEIPSDWVPRGERGRFRPGGVPVVPIEWWVLDAVRTLPHGSSRARPIPAHAQHAMEAINATAEFDHGTERDYSATGTAVGQTSAAGP